jgi:hypothetical protein
MKECHLSEFYSLSGGDLLLFIVPVLSVWQLGDEPLFAEDIIGFVGWIY